MTWRAMIAILIVACCMWQAMYCGYVNYVDASDCVYEHDMQYIRCCESRDQYDIISTDGSHYGAYQFDLPTWYSVGGVGLPNEATQEEQDYRATYLYSLRGRLPWQGCFA